MKLYLFTGNRYEPRVIIFADNKEHLKKILAENKENNIDVKDFSEYEIVKGKYIIEF